VTERRIFFTEQFFDELGRLLPLERQADGTPSLTDFLLIDLPAVRDRLLADFEGATLPVPNSNVRVLVGFGPLVPRFAIYAELESASIEVFWITISLDSEDFD
jgi:hypothetical protein